jgi:hypothetical protein
MSYFIIVINIINISSGTNPLKEVHLEYKPPSDLYPAEDPDDEQSLLSIQVILLRIQVVPEGYYQE